MKLYVIWDNVTETFFSQTESKRVANTYLGDAKWSVWCIEGRRGNQINGRFNRWKWAMENNGRMSEGITEVKQKIITRKRTEEHNLAISRSLRGKPKSLEHCDAISQSMMGNGNRS